MGVDYMLLVLTHVKKDVLQVEKVCVMIYMIKVCNVKSTW